MTNYYPDDPHDRPSGTPIGGPAPGPGASSWGGGDMFNNPPGIGGPAPTPHPMAAGGQEPPKPPKKRKRVRGRGDGDKPVNKRVLSTQRIAALGLALVAVLAAISLTSVPDERSFVVRARTPIPAGSTVEPSQIEAVALPPAAIEEGAITGGTADEALEAALDVIDFGRARQYIHAGRQLHTDDLSLESELREPLAGDERLISVSAAVSGGVGGQLLPGDRVDVIAIASITFADDADVRIGPDGEELPERATGRVVRTVATDIEIVSVFPAEQFFDNASQQQVGEDTRTPSELLPARPVPGIYVMRASLEDANILALANSQATLVLALRGADAEDPLGLISPITLEDLLGLPSSARIVPDPNVTSDLDLDVEPGESD